MSKGYQRQCVYFTGIPGSCRFNERCAFSHDLTVHVNSKFKYVAPTLSLTRTVVFGDRTNAEEKIVKETVIEKPPVATEVKHEEQMLNTYSKEQDLLTTDKVEYLNKFFKLGTVPYLAPTRDLA